ncbi:MAG: ATP-sensitive inward rectifier potassium channel 10 [Betaproteobacteria bacterium]|nr:ATP-sensitive inward rectifier potassium channel 10 [Betaproteobacteria bacterium]
MSAPNKPRVHTVRVGDTQILARGRRQSKLRDPYHLVLSLSWPRFFGALVLAFILMNLIFGAAYWLLPGSVANARAGIFLDYFFFSIETLATVGYGAMSPASLSGHIVASVEILTGMVGIALITGLVFARFSKPTARILFSQRAVLREFEGQRVLMLRIANERYNRIMEATATLSLVRVETSPQGESFLRIHDLNLIRQRTPVFALTWTLIHPIDQHSPLHGLNAAQLAASHSRILASVTGHDETMSTPVHASSNYEAEDLVFDARFVDILSMTPEGERLVDLTRFHDIEAM